MPDSSQPDTESLNPPSSSFEPPTSHATPPASGLPPPASFLMPGLGLMVAALLLYITAPLLAHAWSLVIPREVSDSTVVTLSEEVRMRTLRVFVIGWILTLGLCVGSFLNVVIYRSPRGRTLLGSSKCPRCRHPIRARHNIPVLGWLFLQGRCFDCGLPISRRYPLVEATVGAVFLTLAGVELFAGGWNLPLYTGPFLTGIAWFIFSPQEDLIRVFALHVALLTVLLSWGLMQWDRVRLPPAYRLASFAAPLLLGMVFPNLFPILHTGTSGMALPPPTWKVGLTTVALGGVWGSFVGWMLAASSVRWDSGAHDLGPRREFLREVESGFGLVGLVLGWQAVALLGFMSAISVVVSARTSFARRSERARLLLLFVVTWIYIMFWRPLSLFPWLPGPESSWFFHALLLLLSCALIYAGRPRRNRPAQWSGLQQGSP